jgi:hypothetical protein
MFGTDNGIDESLVYIDVSRAFLETFDEFECRDLHIMGIGLERNILEKIYHSNFERLAGKMPRKINKKIMFEECNTVMDIIRHDKNVDILLPDVQEIFEKINTTYCENNSPG